MSVERTAEDFFFSSLSPMVEQQDGGRGAPIKRVQKYMRKRGTAHGRNVTGVARRERKRERCKLDEVTNGYALGRGLTRTWLPNRVSKTRC